MGLVGYRAAGGGLTPRTYYLEDDWDDNALSSRTNADAGAWFYQPVPSQPGDTLVGRYRPSWASISGTPSATNGELVLSAGDTTTQNVVTDSEVEAGTWITDFQFSSDPTTKGATHSFFSKTDTVAASDSRLQDCYLWYISNNGSFDLSKDSGGSYTSLISGSWGDDLNSHTGKSTRDESGNFELFGDGTSQGTATDTTHTVCYFDGIGNATDVEVAFDNLTVQ